MFKIALINMPFAALDMPSIGLTQLKTVLDRKLAERVSVEICYVNQDLALVIGTEPYHRVSYSLDIHNSGLGEWFFRQVAYPDLPDNTEQYFQRFFPYRNEQVGMLRFFIQEKRQLLEGFLDAMIDKYKLDQFDIVGLTSMFTQNAASFAMARKIKSRNPNIIVVMGGANCESPMGEEIIRNVEHLDFAFSGPALKSFPQFVENCMNQRFDQNHKISGVFSKRNCSAPRPQAMLGQSIPISTLGEELDLDVPVPLDYGPFLDILEKNFPNREIEPVLLFETSRGCWWGEKAHCTFCGLNASTMKYRAMSYQNAIDLIASLFKYASRCSILSCVDNILPKSYLKEVLPHLDTPENMSIFYEVKSDLTEEDLQVLAKAHVTHIQPGVEALATSTLKLMKKGSSAFQNITLLKNCVMYGIEPEWNLLVGFPGESEIVYKKYVQDMPLLVHLPPPNGVYPVRFDRYSPYFTKAKEYGLNLHPVDYYSLTYPFGEESLEKVAYFFSDHNANAAYFATMYEWIGAMREKYNVWVTRWRDSPRASLHFEHRTDQPTIYDSRSGKETRHNIGRLAYQLLCLMNKPKRIPDIQTEMKHVAPAAIESEIASLQQRGLLFNEGERLLSLVLPRKPSTD